MSKDTTLRTSLELATARAARLVKAEDRAQLAEERRAAWQNRLDPAAYTCTRDGKAWIAEGPAGQRFELFKNQDGDGVIVLSHSGGIYAIALDASGLMACDCKAREKAPTCKHETALRAVKMARRMEKAEEEKRRAEEREAERAAKAFEGAADVPAEVWR